MQQDYGKIPVENLKYSYSQFAVVEIVEVQRLKKEKWQRCS